MSNNPFGYTMVHAPGSTLGMSSQSMPSPVWGNGYQPPHISADHGFGSGHMPQQLGSPLGNLYRGLQPSTLGNLGQIQRRFGLMGWTPGQNNPWMPQQQPWQLPQGQQNPIQAGGASPLSHGAPQYGPQYDPWRGMLGIR